MNQKIGKQFSKLGEMITELCDNLQEQKETNKKLCGELADTELSKENQELREEIDRLRHLNDGLRTQLTREKAEKEQLVQSITRPVAYTVPVSEDFNLNWHFTKMEGYPKEDGYYLIAISDQIVKLDVRTVVDGELNLGLVYYYPTDVYAWVKIPGIPKEC